MAYAVWSGLPWITYRYRDEFLTVEVRNGGPGQRRDLPVEDLARRRYRLPEELSDTDRMTLGAFLLARGWKRDAFLFQDPKDYARTAVALSGPVNGSNKVFALTTTSTAEEYRHFPKQGSVVAYVDGVPVAIDSVDTDGRTVTLHSAPAAGVVTADFTGLRLVKLVEEPEVAGATTAWFQYDAELEEIIRET